MRYIALDANILLHDPSSLYSYGPGTTVVLIATVIEEIDSKKREPGELGANAREVTRKIKEFKKGHEGRTTLGIPLPGGGRLLLEMNHKDPSIMKDKFFSDINDNKILTVVLNMKKEAEDSLSEATRKEIEVLQKEFKLGNLTYKEYWEKYYEKTGFLYTLVTNDTIVDIKSDMLFINYENYEKDRIKNIDEIHKGYHFIEVPIEVVNAFYASETGIKMVELEPYIRASLELPEDEPIEKHVYVQDFLRLCVNGEEKGFGRVLQPNGVLTLTKLIIIEEMEEAKKKNKDWAAPYGLIPKNAEQKMLMEVLLDPNVDMVIAIGGAGTGKTILITACGIQQVANQALYNKMMVSKPIIALGKDIGYLPGEKDDKLRSWIQPIQDNIEQLMRMNEEHGKTQEQIEKEKQNRSINKIDAQKIHEEMRQANIEMEALTYMRGRSIADTYMYFDEFQNATPHEGKSVVTRSGKNTKQILSGDIYQIDHPYLDSNNNALAYISERMKQEPNVAIVMLEKTERSKLAEQAANLL